MCRVAGLHTEVGEKPIVNGTEDFCRSNEIIIDITNGARFPLCVSDHVTVLIMYLFSDIFSRIL
jgi:hypothetical protein